MALERKKPESAEHHACKAAMADALSAFQMIEVGLKIYLDIAYRLIEKTFDGRLVVRLPRNNLENRSLGQLLREFQKYSGNDTFIKAIEKLLPERNKLAHHAFYDVHRATLKGNELIKMGQKAKSLHRKVHECSGLLEKEIEMIYNLYKEIPLDSKSG